MADDDDDDAPVFFPSSFSLPSLKSFYENDDSPTDCLCVTRCTARAAVCQSQAKKLFQPRASSIVSDKVAAAAAASAPGSNVGLIKSLALCVGGWVQQEEGRGPTRVSMQSKTS